MKKWEIVDPSVIPADKFELAMLMEILLRNRSLVNPEDRENFLQPPDPYGFTADTVGIDPGSLQTALSRIGEAIDRKESIVVYADYDADGVTAGAIMWETLYLLGAKVMPYIPHRVEEGYGLSQKGIDTIIELYHPGLVITVDHGVTAWEKVKYAQEKGIDLVVTDHHVLPDKLPDCPLVHTTKLCGAGVAWFVTKEIMASRGGGEKQQKSELLALACIGTIADLVPLIGPNRSIVKYGLEALNRTKRIGLMALMGDAGLTAGDIDVYGVSHVLAPRLNAMGRLEHALDALRLLCTKKPAQAFSLAKALGLTNKERQQLTEEFTLHAKDLVTSSSRHEKQKLLFMVHESYNQGVIGLVAGKLVEEYYRPTIVIAKGEKISKASARSIIGFNIVEAIRSASDLLVDVGGHPMAAGFTVTTDNLDALQARLEALAAAQISDEQLVRVLRIDCQLPLTAVDDKLWVVLENLRPFGFGNVEPVFVSERVRVMDKRFVGQNGKHLKLRLASPDGFTYTAIGFNLGGLYEKISVNGLVDIAYTVDMNLWNNHRELQLRLRDVHFD